MGEGTEWKERNGEREDRERGEEKVAKGKGEGDEERRWGGRER